MREQDGSRQGGRGVPEDPTGIEEPHDVLAAEEFAMPVPEERYPRDPSGIDEPHDVLAAEEFAMPSPADRASGGGRSLDPRAAIPLALVALAAALLVRRLAR